MRGVRISPLRENGEKRPAEVIGNAAKLMGLQRVRKQTRRSSTAYRPKSAELNSGLYGRS